jgi:signal peptidase I
MSAGEETRKSPLEHIKASLPLVWLILALLALRWTIVEPYVVPTGSMEPTLKPGDRLYALKCAYDIRFPFTDYVLFKIRPVKRGDVILFRAPPDPDVTYVKRAVGIPGDRISLHAGKLFVNGQEVPEARITGPKFEIMYDIENSQDKILNEENLTGVKHWMVLDTSRPVNREFPGDASIDGITVPEDSVFAVGDNRDNSHDSRAWGFVPMANMKGRAMFIWFSSRDWRVRPERIGTLIQ